MIKNVIGTIQDINVLKKTEKYTLHLVKLDNIDLTTFDKAISDHFKIGDKVEIDYEESEKYNTIKTIKLYIEGAKEVIEEVNNSLNQSVDERVINMINNNTFTTDFVMNERCYEITIKEK